MCFRHSFASNQTCVCVCVCVCVCILISYSLSIFTSVQAWEGGIGRMNYNADINVKRGLQHKSGAEVGAAVVIVVSPVPV